MGKINPEKIEEWSIDGLKGLLKKSEYIKSEINSNDKTPSWDGNLYLYSNKELKKEQLIAKVPIQIKGHEVNKEKDLNKEKITFSVKISDLRNYQNDGGVIFFVIYVLNSEEYKIFYRKLLPYDLKRLLNNLKNKQRTKKIKLCSFPTDIKKIEEMINYFQQDRKKQYSTTEAETIDLLDFEKIKENMKCLSKIKKLSFSSTLDNLFDEEHYLYAEKISNVYSPIARMKVESMKTIVPLRIYIDEKEYFQKAEVILRKAKIDLCISKCVYIKQTDESKGALKIERKGTLIDFINGLNFVKSISTCSHFNIGDMVYGEKVTGFDLILLQKDIDFFERVKVLLEHLNVQKPLEMESLSEKDFRNLDILYEYIVENKDFKIECKKDSGIEIYEVGNLKLMFLFFNLENGKGSYYNFFDRYISNRCKLIKNFNEKRVEYPIYILLTKDCFLEIDNINYEVIKESIMNVKEYSNEYGNDVNELILDLLKAYDEKKESIILETALDIIKWLKEKDNSIYIVLNYYQTILRKRALSKEEIKNLKSLERKEENIEILLGISIILENKTNIDYYLEELTVKQKEKFKQYPIWNLVKESK